MYCQKWSNSCLYILLCQTIGRNIGACFCKQKSKWASTRHNLVRLILKSCTKLTYISEQHTYSKSLKRIWPLALDFTKGRSFKYPRFQKVALVFYMHIYVLRKVRIWTIPESLCAKWEFLNWRTEWEFLLCAVQFRTCPCAKWESGQSENRIFVICFAGKIDMGQRFHPYFYKVVQLHIRL